MASYMFGGVYLFLVSILLSDLFVDNIHIYSFLIEANDENSIPADLRTDTDLYKTIEKIQIAIEARNQPCYHNKDIHSARDFIGNVWQNEIPNNLSVIAFPFCLEHASLGNWLGNYFNEASCALISGSHFVTTKREYRKVGNPDIPVNMIGDHIAFYDAFPDVVVNKHASNFTTEEVKKNLQENCRCPSYCWSSSDAPWTKNVPWIRHYIRKAVAVYLETAKLNFTNQKLVTLLSNDTGDMSSLPLTQELPFIPDVLIHYRCGDNIVYGKFGYGLLPFAAFVPHISPDAKYIYILSDHPRRFGVQGFTHWCNTILSDMFDFLREKFPDKVVAIKKGGDQFLDFARIVYTNVTICSVSTFCMYPALGSNGTVHFPVSKLLPHHQHHADSTPASYLASHIQWFHEPAVITNMKDYHPWHLIRHVLKGSELQVKELEGQIIKGSSRSVFFVKNGTRHAFGGMEVFEGLGFKWEDIWAISDKYVFMLPQGEDMKLATAAPK